MSPWSKRKKCVVWAEKHLIEVSGWTHACWPEYMIHKAVNDPNFPTKGRGHALHRGWVITDLETGRLVDNGFKSRQEALEALPELDKKVVSEVRSSPIYGNMVDKYRRLLMIRSEVEVKKR